MTLPVVPCCIRLKNKIKGIFKNTTYPSLLEKGKRVEVVKERFLEMPLNPRIVKRCNFFQFFF